MGRPLTIDELRYGIIGSLALLEFLKAKRGEIPEASIAEYRKNVEPEVAQFEALLRAEGAEQMRLKIVKEAFGAENEEFVSVPMSLLTPIPETPEEYYLMCEKAGLSPAPKELT